MPLKEYILENSFKIVFMDNKLDIINYIEIIHFDSTKILIQHDKGCISIIGDNLYVSRLLKDEILIEGSIKKLEFR